MQEPYLSAVLGGEARNVDMVGAMVAWLATNNYLAPPVANAESGAVARLKMQDMSGAAFLTTILGGDLRPDDVASEIRSFCEEYVASGNYADDYEDALRSLESESPWEQYDAVAPRITAAYREHQQPASTLGKVTAKILRFPSRS